MNATEHFVSEKLTRGRHISLYATTLTHILSNNTIIYNNNKLTDRWIQKKSSREGATGRPNVTYIHKHVPLLSTSMSTVQFHLHFLRSEIVHWYTTFLQLFLSLSFQSSQQCHHASLSLAYLGFFCRLTCLQKHVYRYSDPWSLSGWNTAAFISWQCFRTPSLCPSAPSMLHWFLWS